MVNYNFLATLGSSQKNFGKTHGQKISTRSANIVTPYLQVLQNTLFGSSTSRNNSYVGNSANYGNPYVSDPRDNILKGDANNDGVVDKNDLEVLQLNLIGLGNVKNFRGADMDGDGEITPTDVSQLNLLLKEKNPLVSKIKGDVNGDGKIDVVNDAVTIINHVNGKISKNDFLYDNADVTGDSKVDLTDAETIRAFANGEINSLNPYQIWESVAKIKLPVYTDGYLSVRSGNEEVWAGDKVTVLNENNKAYFIRYPAGNTYKERWVSKTIFDEPIPPPPPQTYQTWEATATGYKAAFTDENLSNRIGNEAVYAGDKITVLDERDSSYLVRYPASNGYKERWVSKSNIVPYTEPIIPEPLQNLIDKWNGKTWKDHTYLPGVKQCKEFASYIFNELYHTGYVGSGSTSSNYYNWRLNDIPSSIYQVAEVPQTNNATQAKQAFKNLFQQAKPGDFIQIKRGSGGAHSAIFVGYNENGVQWLDANADNKNGIKLQTYSWDDLIKTTSSGKQWNVAMSIYRAK